MIHEVTEGNHKCLGAYVCNWGNIYGPAELSKYVWPFRNSEANWGPK